MRGLRIMTRHIPNTRIREARVAEDELIVALYDGRTISAPLAWFPRLWHASHAARANWQVAGAGYGLHWPELDEDISIDGLLRGAPSPEFRKAG
jgi:hypothetical protein